VPFFNTSGYEFEKVYNLETLENYFKYADNDIRRMEEMIESVRNYQKNLADQMEKVRNTSTSPVINLERFENIWEKKITFNVSVEHVPMNLVNGKMEEVTYRGRKVNRKFTDRHDFSGRERNAAIKKAEELAKIYKCEIKKKGF
jgi:hypothetical protein